jgi:two-component system sensor histidine kinase/response regulator
MLTIHSPTLILTPDNTILHAIAQLNQLQTSSAVVVEHQRLVGVFTEQDLIRTITNGVSLTAATVGEVMSVPSNVLLESEVEDRLAVLARFQQQSQQQSSSFIPVVDQQGLFVGIVTLAAALESVLAMGVYSAKRSLLPASVNRSSFQEALQRAERSNQLLWEVFPNLLIRMTRSGNYLDFIPAKAFKSFTPAPDIYGKTIFDVMPPDFAQERMRYVQLALQTGQTQTYEFELEIDGEQRYQEAQIIASGEDEVLIIVREITDRKRLELALSVSQTRLASILNNAGASIKSVRVYADQTWECDYCSPSCEHVLGYSPEELPEIWWSRVYEEDKHLVILPALRCVYAEQPTSVEYRFWHKDGTLRWISSDLSSYRDDAQDCWVVTLVETDITHRKQVEEALRKSEERFREIAETVSQVFLIRCAKTGQYLYINPAYETIWERTCESLYAEPNSWVEAVHPDDRLLLSQSLEHQFQGITVTREYRLVRSDGSIRWVKANLSPIYDEAGQLVRFIGIAEDITECRQVEEELRVSKQQLSLALEAAKAGTWEWSLTDNRAVWSDQCFQLMGYAQESTKPSYENWLRSICFQDRDRVEQEARQALSEKDYFCIEYRLASSDDSVRWLADMGHSIRDQQGNLVGAIGILLDITEQKRIEEELRESQRFIQSIADASPNLLYLYDIQENRNVYVNRRIERILEYTSEEIQAIRSNLIQSLIHPDDVAAFSQNVQYIMGMSDGEIFEFEYRMRQKNGEWRWLRSLDTVFERDSDGKPKLLLGTAIDITERKQAEEQLQFQAFLLDAVEQAVVATDTAGYITYWNRGAETLYGWSATEAIGQCANDFLTSESYQQQGAEILSDLRTGKAWTGEFEVIRKDGSLIQIMISNSPVYDKQQQLVGFIGVATDITERKQAEAAIELSERKYRDLVQMAGSIILRHDTSGRITFLNEYGQQFFGYREEDILNRDIVGTLVPEAESTGRNLRELVAQLCQDPQNTELAENENILSTGERVWVKWADKPIYNDRGEVVEILSVGVDITERKRAEQALALAKEAAESASRAKSEFLSMMSHELRTPLTSILGFAEVIANDSSLSIEHQGYLTIIRQSGTHLLNLINSVLEMSKIEAGELVLNPKNFDLYQMLERIEALFQLKATSKGLELCMDWAIDLPQYIQADEGKLHQILINLLDNAIKFTSSGRVVLRGSCRDEVGSASPWLHVEIEDTGMGIASEEIDALFEAFVQTESGRRLQQGTGLGLAISHRFIQMMGGTITVQSQVGEGTTFTIEIPFEMGEPPSPNLPTFEQQRIIGLTTPQTYRVLVVDDQASTQAILVKLLKDLGFDVCEAVSGEEAIVIWQHWQPHLIWLDLRLPDISGYEVARTIRQREQTPQNERSSVSTRIIALTANALAEHRLAARNAGCNDFVSKPFQQVDILNKMAEQLGLEYHYAEASQTEFAPSPSLYLIPQRSQQEPHQNLQKHSMQQPALLTADALQEMPAEWLTNLHLAALRLSSSQCLMLIGQLPRTHAAVAQTLTEWVDRFQFEALVEWVEAYQTSDKPADKPDSR